AADAPSQGAAHELADRPAQEGRPFGLLLRRGQGALPPGRGDLRAGLPGRARHQRAAAGGQGPTPAVRGDPRGRPAVPQGGRGRGRGGGRAPPPPPAGTGGGGGGNTRHYMIMEYVEGMNLRDFLRLRTRLKGPEALPLMLGLAEGMKYSLEQGITHRDIKG